MADAERLDKDKLDKMWREKRNWNGGIYFNKDDPRFWVPKTPYRAWSWGWTINFGHDWAEPAVVGGIVAIALAAGLGGRYKNFKLL